MTRTRPTTAAALLALLLLAACGTTPTPGPEPQPEPEPEVTLTLVNAYPEVAAIDTYVDGALVTPPEGTAPGETVDLDLAAGPRTVTVFEHGGDPAARATDRADTLLQEQSVTVPEDGSADLAVGHSPAGGVGLPYVAVFPNTATASASGTTMVVRHVADAPTVRCTLRLAGPDAPVTADVGRGEETVLAASKAGDGEWSLFALNEPWFDDALGQEVFAAGSVLVVYAAGRATAPATDTTTTTSTFTAYARVLPALAP